MRLLTLTILVAAIVAAWLLRFAQDDAFISFHYARNLVEGSGLTWFGERVEGYTNFLWVLWIAAGLAVGVGAQAWSYVGGLTAWALALLATARLARRLSPNPGTSVLALLVLATNYTFLSYATGGLETMPQTALLAWATHWCLALCGDRGNARLALGLSLLFAAALLTRLDSAVLVAPLGLFAMLAVRRRESPGPLLFALIAPALLIVGGWLAWKVTYYGRVLPNTYYAKVGDPLWANGLTYLGRFLTWYWWWPVAAVAAIAALTRAPRHQPWLVVSASCAAWLAYVVWVGGDFMEFRFLVPIAPLLSAVLAASVHDALGNGWIGRPQAVSTSVLALLIAGSITHASRDFRTTADRALDSIPQLADCYGLVRRGDWHELGTALHDRLVGLDVSLAMHPVGAIPYFSRIPTIDMWGLNDRDVATSGNRVPVDFNRPGHRRHASLAQLHDRKVTFVLGHPTLVRRRTLANPRNVPSLRGFVRDAVRFETAPIDQVTLVEIPVDDHRAVIAWYLTPTVAVDRALQRRRWVTVRFSMNE